MVMHHYGPDHFQKRLVCCLQVQGHCEGSHDQNMTFSDVFWSAYPFASKIGLMAHHYKLSSLSKDWIALLWSRSRSQERLRISVIVQLDDISSTAEPSVTKLGLVHHGPECHARRLVCCLQVQGHSEGSNNQVWLFLPYLLNCLSFCNCI